MVPQSVNTRIGTHGADRVCRVYGSTLYKINIQQIIFSANNIIDFPEGGAILFIYYNSLPTNSPSINSSYLVVHVVLYALIK